MITLDTSAIVGVGSETDPAHAVLVRELEADLGPYLVPMTIMAEAAYMLDVRVGAPSVLAFLEDLRAGIFVGYLEHDIPRITELMRRFRDLPLGYADAAVVSCAERNGGRVLTLDYRHFNPVAREGRIRVLPEDWR